MLWLVKARLLITDHSNIIPFMRYQPVFATDIWCCRYFMYSHIRKNYRKHIIFYCLQTKKFNCMHKWSRIERTLWIINQCSKESQYSLWKISKFKAEGNWSFSQAETIKKIKSGDGLSTFVSLFIDALMDWRKWPELDAGEVMKALLFHW